MRYFSAIVTGLWHIVGTAKGISHLVVQSQQRFVSGYLRWFTDLPGNNYHITAVFPLDEDMTIIGHGAPAAPANPPVWAMRGVKERINTPASEIRGPFPCTKIYSMTTT